MKWIYSVPLLLSLHLWGREPRLFITCPWDQTVQISELISSWQSSLMIIVWVMQMTLLRLPKLCDLKPFFSLHSQRSHRGQREAGRLCRNFSEEEMRHVLQQQGRICPVSRSRRVHEWKALYARRCHSSEDRLRSVGAAGADVRQVALMLWLISVHAEHRQALTHLNFHAFLDRLSPSLLQVHCRGWKQPL